VVETEFAELLRHALLAAMHVGAPVLVVAFVVSAVTGLLQAATGIHETAVGLLPRLLAVGFTLVATLPWMLERMVDLFRAAAGAP
jgi:flagellar biosynthesis protein FliQ